MKYLLGILLTAVSLTVLFAQEAVYDLADLTEMALKNSAVLAVVRAEAAEAEARESQARAEKRPLLTGHATYSWVGFPQDAISVEAGELGTMYIPDGSGSYTEISLPSEEVTFIEGMTHNYYQAGLTLVQPLYTGGKLNLAIRAAEKASQASTEAVTAEKKKIRSELQILLVSLAVLDRMETHLARQEEIIPRLIGIVREGYDKGFLLRTDLLEAELAGGETKVAREEMRNRKRGIIREIRLMTGLASLDGNDLSYPYPEEFWMKEPPLPPAEILWEEALKNNGDLKQLALSREALKLVSKLQSREKSPVPELGFQLDLSYGNDALPYEEEDWYDGSVTATASLVLRGTIFDGGRDRAAWEEAQAGEIKGDKGYEEMLRELRNSLESSWAELTLIASRIEYEDIRIEKLKAEIMQKEQIWKTGTGGEEDYLSKLLEGESAAINRYGVILEYFQIFYRIQYLTGADL